MKSTSLLLALLLLTLPVYGQITQEDIDKTIIHKDKLVTERNAALVTENEGLRKQVSDLETTAKAQGAIVDTVPDLNKQISAQNSEISSLKWSRWKYAIISVLISVPLGILLAIGSFLAVKAGWAGAQAATKLAAIAAKA